MLNSQYMRIERIAGGVHCTDTTFIKAFNSVLVKHKRGYKFRTLRHQMIKRGLTLKNGYALKLSQCDRQNVTKLSEGDK